MRRLGFYITLSADGMYADPEGGSGRSGRPRTSTASRTSWRATPARW